MPKKNQRASTSKATNVARNNSEDIDLENHIASEFVIVSSDEQIEDQKKFTGNNTKKTSSKGQHDRKGGPGARMLNLIKQQQEDRKLAEIKADEERKRIECENEEMQRREEERLRLEEEHREKLKENERNRIQRQRDAGTYLTKKQRRMRQYAQVQLAAAGIELPARHTPPMLTTDLEDSKKRGILYGDRRKANNQLFDVVTKSEINTIESQDLVLVEDEDTSNDVWEQISNQNDTDHEEYQMLSVAGTRCNSASHVDESDRSLSPVDELRAPVICVLGHVDAGKTTLLDNLRRTHVQATEANGITQQIGATNVPLETIYERVKNCRNIITEGDLMVPGLLIIDTPGHETFKNLRSRGSSLCDLAILVVDIMHGLAPQTIESIKLLKKRKTPFIIALNKVDLLYGWKSNNEDDVELVCEQQSTFTKNQFERRCNQIIVEFAEQYLNVALYYKNSDPNEFYSMVPVSARTGDGMGSLIALIMEKCQTNLAEHLKYSDELQATVMEVKKTDGFGTTIDVILVNGCLSVGDTIMVAGPDAPVVTRIRELLIPETNQELRVTNQYQKHKKVKGACGMKILAHNLEKSMAGLPLFVIREKKEIEYYQQELEVLLRTTLNSIELDEAGVYVQASTLGSLEALLQLLKTSKIPCAGINIGSVHRKDVSRASTQHEKKIEWATILAFDVKVEKDAQEYAKTIGVKILQHDEVYHLRDMFKSYQEEMLKVNQKNHGHLAVFPCKLRILPQFVFNSRNPIICGVRIEAGFLRLNTPICVPSREGIDLGRVTSIEKNHQSLDIARAGDEVCIKIESSSHEAPKMYRRHFDENDLLVSKISRESIDVLKAHFRDQMQMSDWKLVIELKQVFGIV